MRIKELQLQNFKFFTGNTESNTLRLPNGENVLVWGENGSGKSSIYWAIYTLLQCSYKDQTGIDNYFTPAHEKNLVNIHKPEADRAFIRMALDDGNEYKIELADYSVIGNVDLQQSAVSSDFIDYNVVASFLKFMHKYEPEQMPLFEEQIFRFMPFNSPAPHAETIKYFDKALEKINEELQKDPITNKYPTAGSTAYDQYKNLVDEFNRQLRQELGLVNVKANQILATKFGYPIEIELRYTPIEFQRTSTQFRFTHEASIILKINNYYGHPDTVKRPHSFLNEAKKTAIGLSIRLGILERRLLADKLNVLALDDLLISLDMSNREVVLNLLFEEYEQNYQLLIFTHDKQLYNIAKNKIGNGIFTHNWKFWEFYVNEKDPAIPEPRFFETKSQLSIAFNHLQENDYPAAANYLRKHCEYLIETYLPQYCYRDVNRDKSHKNYPLDSMITNSVIFLDRINGTDSKAKFTDLKQYVEMMLNPLSHTERGVERHKGEIKAVIKTLEELEIELKMLRFSIMPIMAINTDLFLILVKDANNTFKIQIKLKEDLFIFEEVGIIKLSKCLTDSVYYWHYQNNAIHQEGNFAFHQNKELAVSYSDIAGFATIAVPVMPNWETLFTKSDGTLINTLMVL